MYEMQQIAGSQLENAQGGNRIRRMQRFGNVHDFLDHVGPPNGDAGWRHVQGLRQRLRQLRGQRAAAYEQYGLRRFGIQF